MVGSWKGNARWIKSIFRMYRGNYDKGMNFILAITFLNDQSVYRHAWCDLGELVGSRTSDIFSFLFDWNPHQERYVLLKTPPESDQWFQSYSNWKILKTIENKRNSSLFLAVSHSQCSRLLTDPTRSQHILMYFWLIPLDRNTYECIILKLSICRFIRCSRGPVVLPISSTTNISAQWRQDKVQTWTSVT